MTFLPDGEMLITERDGYVRRYSNTSGLSERLSGSPTVIANNQGGMLDIILDPDFATNNTVYMCYSRPDSGSITSSSVSKAVLTDNGFVNAKDIFIADTKLDNGFHFGCRLAFDAQKHLYVAMGDRYKLMKDAQKTDNHAGKIVRITRDGEPVESNPFLDGKAPEVYTYGHRNI
jgi:glucose/arabinose dehydrogenase